MSTDPPEVVVASPVRPGRAVNYEDAFAYLFRRPGGWGKLAVGGVLLLFFWLIVPLLVVLGYGVALGRMVAEGREDLPRFELGMAADGLRAVVVTFGYLLPLFLVYLVAIIPMAISADSGGDAAGGIFFVAGMLVFLLVMAYGLAYALLQPAIFAVFIAGGSIAACFSPRRIRAVVTHWGGTYFAIAVILIGISQIVGFGFILFVIGIAFAYFYFLAVSAHFAGQLARPLLQTAPPPPPDWAGSSSAAPVPGPSAAAPTAAPPPGAPPPPAAESPTAQPPPPSAASESTAAATAAPPAPVPASTAPPPPASAPVPATGATTAPPPAPESAAPATSAATPRQSGPPVPTAPPPAAEPPAGATTAEIAPLPSDTTVLEVPADPSPSTSDKPPPSPAG